MYSSVGFVRLDAHQLSLQEGARKVLVAAGIAAIAAAGTLGAKVTISYNRQLKLAQQDPAALNPAMMGEAVLVMPLLLTGLGLLASQLS